MSLENFLSLPITSETINYFINLLTEHQQLINNPIYEFDNQTFLYELCLHNNMYIDYIKILLNKGANPNIIGSKRMSSFDLVCHKGEYILFQLLLPYSVINPLIQIKSPLMHACFNGNMDIIETLVELGADINYIGPNNITALLIATRKGQLDTVKFLCNNGANINKYIFEVCMLGNISIFDIYLLFGANVYEIDEENDMTCLIAAVHSNNVEMVERVLVMNVDINYQNKKGFTALIFACASDVGEEKDKIINLLLTYGADKMLKTFNGKRAGFFCSRELRDKYDLPI